ncbi:hypothetical protein R5R35_000280 [Gryllus longicercus]|uniref:Uncharacterized protein n=1 Tax=Gryllus longicercus TaxID=2509291 RepID=A0AAN9V8M7_9ORTH
MLASGRTGIVCKIVLLVSLLVVVTTVTLIMHAIMSNRRSLLRRTSARHDASFSKVAQPGGGGGGGGRSERGLMALISNVTKTVIAMEVQATSLNDELRRVREKTRELLLQQRHSALWAVLHKCVLLYSCKEPGAGRAPPPGASQRPQASGDPGPDPDPVVSVHKIHESKYSMYRLRRRP